MSKKKNFVVGRVELTIRRKLDPKLVWQLVVDPKVDDVQGKEYVAMATKMIYWQLNVLRSLDGLK